MRTPGASRNDPRAATNTKYKLVDKVSIMAKLLHASTAPSHEAKGSAPERGWGAVDSPKGNATRCELATLVQKSNIMSSISIQFKPFLAGFTAF